MNENNFMPRQPVTEPDQALRFIIAKDNSNRWVVLETHGLFGGVFVSEYAAIHFVKEESAKRNASCEVISDAREIDARVRARSRRH